MLAENFLKTQQVLYPKDFEVCISVEVDTKTNVMMVNTYIYVILSVFENSIFLEFPIQLQLVN